MKKIICFDLEGPLSPMDHAYEAMKLAPNGQRLFEAISRFDDILALRDLRSYEPGDTLKLIAPFLIYSGVTEAQLREISEKATLIPGAKELIEKLDQASWQIFVISTSYEQHAFNIAKRLGIPKKNVFCTKFPPKEVMGGARKIEALKTVCRRTGSNFRDLAVVGDSITDFKMLKAVKEAGGLAIVFNGNEYALPYATVGVASDNLMDINNILDVWLAGGLAAVKNTSHCEDIETHKKYRKLLRQSAAKLG